jgi:hypothetical protein
LSPPSGPEVGLTVHDAPSHTSASVVVAPATVEPLPTAMHELAAGHDTADRDPPVSPDAVPIGFIVHAAPSQDSARGWAPEPAEAYPTAIQTVGELHDTPRRALPRAPVGLGAGVALHAAPSSASAKGTVTPRSLTVDPTATHDPDEQDTAVRAPWRATALGLGTIDHGAPDAAATDMGSANSPHETITPATIARSRTSAPVRAPAQGPH